MIYNTVASLNPTGAKADHVIQIRRCDWSRDHPRVRRQGAAVRQERKPEAVVERRDHLQVQAAGKYCTSTHLNKSKQHKAFCNVICLAVDRFLNCTDVIC